MKKSMLLIPVLFTLALLISLTSSYNYNQMNNYCNENQYSTLPVYQMPYCDDCIHKEVKLVPMINPEVRFVHHYYSSCNDCQIIDNRQDSKPFSYFPYS